jgi:hypothetical protein
VENPKSTTIRSVVRNAAANTKQNKRSQSVIEADIIIKFESDRNGPLPQERYTEYDETDRWWLEALGVIKKERVLATVTIPKARLNHFEITRGIVPEVIGLHHTSYIPSRAIGKFTVEYDAPSCSVSFIPE